MQCCKFNTTDGQINVYLFFPKKKKKNQSLFRTYAWCLVVFLFLFLFWAGRGETQCLLVAPKKINV